MFKKFLFVNMYLVMLVFYIEYLIIMCNRDSTFIDLMGDILIPKWEGGGYFLGDLISGGVPFSSSVIG